MTKRRDPGDGTIIERPGRPDGSRFEGRVWIEKDGRPYRKSVYGRTKADVRRKIATEKRRAEEGLAPTDGTTTLSTYIERWLERRDRELRERTVTRYRSLLVGHVLPVIGSRKLSALTPDDVRRVLDRMQDAGLSSTTRSHVRGALRAALQDAVRDGILSRNVASLVRLQAPKPHRPPALSDADIRAVMAAVENDRLGPLFRFIAATGCRLGEASGLRWQDVHWDAGEVEFVQTVGRINGRDVFGDTKTEASRASFPITGPVRAALVEQKRLQDSGLTGAPPRLLVEHGIARGPLVFTAIDGGPLNSSYVTHTFQRLLMAAGIPRLRVHDLRHLFVSSLFAQGVPLEVISGLVRHANPTVTRQIYLHLRQDMRREAAEKMGRVFATGS